MINATQKELYQAATAMAEESVQQQIGAAGHAHVSDEAEHPARQYPGQGTVLQLRKRHRHSHIADGEQPPTHRATAQAAVSCVGHAG